MPPAGTACDTTMKGPTLKGGGSMNADGEKHIEGNFHAVSLSGGKDNEKRYKMKSHLQKD